MENSKLLHVLADKIHYDQYCGMLEAKSKQICIYNTVYSIKC